MAQRKLEWDVDGSAGEVQWYCSACSWTLIARDQKAVNQGSSPSRNGLQSTSASITHLLRQSKQTTINGLLESRAACTRFALHLPKDFPVTNKVSGFLN